MLLVPCACASPSSTTGETGNHGLHARAGLHFLSSSFLLLLHSPLSALPLALRGVKRQRGCPGVLRPGKQFFEFSSRFVRCFFLDKMFSFFLFYFFMRESIIPHQSICAHLHAPAPARPKESSDGSPRCDCEPMTRRAIIARSSSDC